MDSTLDLQIFLAGVMALLLVAPLLLMRYVQRLPDAPTCPSCHSVTRELAARGWVVHLLPVLATTVMGECTHCGWRGRMRWRWAPRPLRGRNG